MDESQVEAVKGAISELDPNDDTHFTKQGKPSANALTELVGFAVSTQLRDKAWEEHQNPSAAAEGGPAPQGGGAPEEPDAGDEEPDEEAKDPESGATLYKSDFMHGNVIKDGNRKIGDWFRHVPTGKKYYAPKSLAKERGLTPYPFGA